MKVIDKGRAASPHTLARFSPADRGHSRHGQRTAFVLSSLETEFALLSPFPTLQRPACLAGKCERPSFAVLYAHRPHHRQHRCSSRLAVKRLLSKTRNHRHQLVPISNVELMAY